MKLCLLLARSPPLQPSLQICSFCSDRPGYEDEQYTVISAWKMPSARLQERKDCTAIVHVSTKGLSTF
jgi:hypothetical protein